jgi:hypothetical protein
VALLAILVNRSVSRLHTDLSTEHPQSKNVAKTVKNQMGLKQERLKIKGNWERAVGKALRVQPTPQDKQKKK